jgi:hypothetical protein
MSFKMFIILTGKFILCKHMLMSTVHLKIPDQYNADMTDWLCALTQDSDDELIQIETLLSNTIYVLLIQLQ